MKRLKKIANFDCSEIQQGDLVDFGRYGQYYVCNPDYQDKYFWVTDDELNRTNDRAQGWSILKSDAQGIIEEYDESDED